MPSGNGGSIEYHSAKARPSAPLRWYSRMIETAWLWSAAPRLIAIGLLRLNCASSSTPSIVTGVSLTKCV